MNRDNEFLKLFLACYLPYIYSFFHGMFCAIKRIIKEESGNGE